MESLGYAKQNKINKQYNATIKLFPALEETLRQGYVVRNEEYGLGISCVAAPILDHTGYVPAAGTIKGTTASIKPKTIDLIPKTMNHPAASSGVSTKDKIDFIVASEGVLGPSFAIKAGKKFLTDWILKRIRNGGLNWNHPYKFTTNAIQTDNG